jgi:hypothetical protein
MPNEYFRPKIVIVKFILNLPLSITSKDLFLIGYAFPINSHPPTTTHTANVQMWGRDQ